MPNLRAELFGQRTRGRSQANRRLGRPVHRSEKDKMLAGELYNAADPELQAEQRATMAWLSKYNAMMAATAADRLTILRERFGQAGDRTVFARLCTATTASTSAPALVF